MYLIAVFLPLFASIISGFFGRKVGADGAKLITTSCVMFTAVLAILTFMEVGFNTISVSVTLFN